MKDIEMRAHFQEIKESLKGFEVASFGTSMMALALGFLGLVFASQWLHLLPIGLGLVIFAGICNVGTLVYVTCKRIARKRRAKE